jgi:hypothetical protein
MIGLRLNRGGAWISLRRAEQNHADKTHHSAETLQNHDAIMAEWLMSLSVRTFARGSFIGGISFITAILRNDT